MKQSKLLSTIRYLSYIYLAVVCAYWWVDNIMARHFNVLMLLLFCICITALVLRRWIVDSVFGALMILGSSYMLMAVISAWQRNSLAGYKAEAANILTFGMAIFGITLFCGVSVLIYGLRTYKASADKLTMRR